MRVWAIGFTRRGVSLARRIADALVAAGDVARVFGCDRFADDAGVEAAGRTSAWAERAFGEADALVFVGATGIAVRAVAPLVRDKFCDPAVVCVDERGRDVVSLVSGHLGGANELARRIATLIGAHAVVSTATDVSGTFALDEWARREKLALVGREAARAISAHLLEGGSVGLSSDFEIAGSPPQGVRLGDEAGALGIRVSLGCADSPYAQTAYLIPRVVTVGVGCRRGADEQDVAALVDHTLGLAGIASEAVCRLATIEAKADEPALVSLARRRGWELSTHTAEELRGLPGDFSHSDFVERTVGVGCVCERAACARGEHLLVPKCAGDGVTCAVAARPCNLSFDGTHEDADGRRKGTLCCVGIGPAGGATMSAEAREALASADLICGYTTYLRLLKGDFPGVERYGTPMRGEVERVRHAVGEAARGRDVAIVSSGDAGVYGMAGLAIELAAPEGIEVRVVPGVTAATAAAALMGAPLQGDWCCVSLSDLMCDWADIERRLDAAASAGFVVCLYNPGSAGRTGHLRRAAEVLCRHLAPDTVCGVARNVGREGQSWHLTSLAALADEQVDMLTCVICGTGRTRLVAGRMVTPRGYEVEGR